jgi:hypothetical protein
MNEITEGIMKRFGMLFFMLIVLCLVGCSQESEFVNPEESDFLSWTKEYLDADVALSLGGSVKEYEKAISDIVGEDLLAERIETANQSAADVEINGKVYSGEEKLRLVFGRETKRIEMAIDISPVYDDLNQERDFFKYVIVRHQITLFDENDDVITERMIPKSNAAYLRKFWFQKLDGRWCLYGIEKMRYFPDENGEYTREEFNGEPIAFTHYKDTEINFMQIE